MLSFGIREHLGALSHKLNLRLDILILAPLVEISEIGYYSIAVVFAQLVWYIPDSIGTFLFPKIASRNNNKSSAKLTAQINRISITVVVLISVIIYFTSKIFIPIMYGIDFQKSVVVIKILLFGTVGLSIQKILTKYFSGIGKPLITSWASIVGLITSVPLLFILVPIYGIIGAAIATAISYLFMAIFAIVLFKYNSDVNLFDLMIVKITDFRDILEKVKK
jgi:O-antigen/teichoic acid export membrane protein